MQVASLQDRPMIRSSPARIAECMRLGWWSGRTVDDALRDAVRLSAREEALVDPPNRTDLVGGAPRRLTWEQLDAQVDACAAGLPGLGVRNLQVHALQLPNLVESAGALLACARLGVLFCAVPMQFRAPVLPYSLTKARVRVGLSV